METSKACRCLPEIPNPEFMGFIGTGGICLYATGRTVAEALERVKQHAKKDRVPKSRWAEVWVEALPGGAVVYEER